MYELVDPLTVVGATINNVTGVTSTPKIRRVNALGFLSFEGLHGLGITRSRQLGPLDRTTTRDAQPILRRTGGLCGSRRGRDGLPHVP